MYKEELLLYNVKNEQMFSFHKCDYNFTRISVQKDKLDTNINDMSKLINVLVTRI